MTFKINFKLIALVVSISTLSIASNVNAEPTGVTPEMPSIPSGTQDSAQEARSTIIWNGLIGSSVPGSNLKITGAGGADIADGTLYINDDGTFTSSSVILEAHEYSVVSGIDDDIEMIGDIQAETSWTYASSQVMINGQMTSNADIIVKDIISNQVFTQGGQSIGSKIKSGRLNLEIVNHEAVTDVDVAGEVQVAVLMTASYEANL